MKKIVILFFVVSLTSYGFAQTTIYMDYDESGNRIYRGIIVQRLDQTPSSQTDYGVSVYPNPSSDNVNITIGNLPKDANVIIELTDEAGKRIAEIKRSTSKEALNIQHLPSGIYYLNIRINSDKVLYKVLKQK